MEEVAAAVAGVSRTAQPAMAASRQDLQAECRSVMSIALKTNDDKERNKT
jgi:hypothetical protein